MSQSYDDFGFEPLDTLCRIWHGDEEMTDEAQKGLDLYAAAHAMREACRAVVEAWEGGNLAEAARMCQQALDIADNSPPLSPDCQHVG
jgi:hypothetical protein